MIVTTNVSLEVYPLPGLVIVIPVTTPPVNCTVPVAVVPPPLGAENETAGAVYPLPPVIIVTTVIPSSTTLAKTPVAGLYVYPFTWFCTNKYVLLSVLLK